MHSDEKNATRGFVRNVLSRDVVAETLIVWRQIQQFKTVFLLSCYRTRNILADGEWPITHRQFCRCGALWLRVELTPQHAESPKSANACNCGESAIGHEPSAVPTFCNQTRTQPLPYSPNNPRVRARKYQCAGWPASQKYPATGHRWTAPVPRSSGARRA